MLRMPLLRLHTVVLFSQALPAAQSLFLKLITFFEVPFILSVFKNTVSISKMKDKLSIQTLQKDMQKVVQHMIHTSITVLETKMKKVFKWIFSVT